MNAVSCISDSSNTNYMRNFTVTIAGKELLHISPCILISTHLKLVFLLIACQHPLRSRRLKHPGNSLMSQDSATAGPKMACVCLHLNSLPCPLCSPAPAQHLRPSIRRPLNSALSNQSAMHMSNALLVWNQYAGNPVSSGRSSL